MGLHVAASAGHNKRGPGPLVQRVHEINHRPFNQYQRMQEFGDLTVIDPRERLKLETPGGPLSMRVMDLFTPIGRGQRGLIVAPPKTGKTTLLKEIATGTLTNHPDTKVFVLLVDERPEEVTDIRRSIPGAEVWASNSDEDVPSHIRTSRMVIEQAKRMVEYGHHVMVILDSITRLARAFNHHVGSSGRTMSGGIDAQAMQEPRTMFGAARNIEHGGSITIIGSALIDTGSRMDELIFQEFKGTGNMEMVLSKKLAERRIWPAIDLPASGTRKEELLLGAEATRKIGILRREMLQRDTVQAMEALLKALRKFPTNEEFLKSF
jgi:transcription termination factor Rho